jgi:ABC-type phosphate/phosphonate transport system substrate-binding protein
MRRASLPMYNLPEMAAANTRFWDALRDRLAAKGVAVDDIVYDKSRAPVPDGIEPDIFFSQICGYPLYKVFRAKGRVLATPRYGVPGCAGPSHCAFFIVRAAEPAADVLAMKGRVFGCNSLLSNSGMNLPRLTLARLGARAPFFAKVVMTGGHIQSLDRLQAEDIDLCSIDCVTWAFFEAHRPAAAARYRVLGETVASPSLPFITSSATPDDVATTLSDTLRAFCADPATAALRAELRLEGVEDIGAAPYEELAAYEREAARLGYPEIA